MSGAASAALVEKRNHLASCTFILRNLFSDLVPINI